MKLRYTKLCREEFNGFSAAASCFPCRSVDLHTQLRVQLCTQLYTQCTKFSTAAVQGAAYTRVHSSTVYYLLIGQDFNMSHRCDMLGSLLPRWTSGYDINLITLVFLDQIARVAQWTTRLPYLKMRTSRSGMSRSLLSNLGILGQHVTPV